ncbi:HAD-IB family hydrolase, partial [Streptomyces sp. NPDC005890]
MLRGVENHSLPRAAAFFDLDKTVIAKSSTLTFSKSFYQGGLINRRAALRTAYAQFVFLAGGLDHDQMERMREYLSALCRGWNVQQVREIVAETLHDLIDPIIYDEAASLIEEHHAAGRDVVIVSTSGAEVVEP